MRRCRQSLPRRKWEMCDFACFFALRPGRIVAVNACSPIWKHIKLILWSCETQNAKPCWLSEPGELRVHSLGSSCKNWGTRCMDKLIPERCWQFGFIVRANWMKKVREVSSSTFSLQKVSWSADRCRLIRRQTLWKQLGKYTVTALAGKKQTNKLGDNLFFPCFLYTESKRIDTGLACAFILQLMLYFLLFCGTHEFKSCWFSEIGDLGTHPSHSILKIWATTYVIQTIFSLGKCWELGIPPW